MLVYFNDMLSSGYIPDLYTPDDTDNVRCPPSFSLLSRLGVGGLVQLVLPFSSRAARIARAHATPRRLLASADHQRHPP